MTAYNVTKSSVLALSETLSAELRGDNIRVNVLCPTLVPTNIMKNGRLPGHYAGLADDLLMNHAFTTSDQVVIKTLNNLDAGKLYTIPQPDAKLFWILKRASPPYMPKRWVSDIHYLINTSNKLRVNQDDNRNNFSYAA
jgi:short-subunit dehydrogenase